MAKGKSDRAALVSAKDFVTAYMSEDSIEGVAKVTGLGIPTIQSRASSLRKKGVSLPKKFAGSKGAARLDIASLNSLVESFNKVVAKGKK
jgi:hypothetical protein